jgi:ring-1,2-phenylacetyl-CoA epoxidase subunit PaaD
MVTPEQSAIAAAAAAAALEVPRPALRALWGALAGVADPEIPVLSVLDLGIVRGIEWDPADPSLLIVRVTPTYSGCPATDVIAQAVREALLRVGVAAVRIETTLSPPWSTAWVSPEGQRKLREYGIAPPGTVRRGDCGVIDASRLGPLRRPGVVVPCPRCGSMRTELVAQFGSTACKAQYRCTECLEPFDLFKSLE